MRKLIDVRLIIVVGIAFLLPLLYLSRYAHPAVDDFQNALWTDFWSTQYHYYKTWSGRYFSNTLLTLDPIHWGISRSTLWFYQLASAALIVLFTVSVTVFINSALKALTLASRRSRWIIALLTLLIAINNLYSFSECFYWFAGSMTYTMPAALVCLLLCQIFSVLKTAQIKSIQFFEYAIGMVLIFIINGSSETTMVLCDAVCAGMYLFFRNVNPRLARYFAALLLFAAACSILMIAAPGNYVRQALHNRDLGLAMKSWLFLCKEVFLKWMLNPAFLIYIVSILAIPVRLNGPIRRMSLIGLLFLPIATLYMLAFPGFWALGDFPPSRALNIIYLFFVIAWLPFLLTLSNILRGMAESLSVNSQQGISQLKYVGIALIALLVINEPMLKECGFVRLWSNIANRVPQLYNNELYERYVIIKNAPDNALVMVPPLSNRTKNLLFFNDINSDPAIWPNTDYAKFWKKQAIAVERDTVSTDR